MLEQKTTYPFEIQIWDDCSIDNTSEICQKYANEYPDKIKYFRQPKNTFTLHFRKMQAYKAIRNIKTKYWCMIDGDDWWCDENKVQLALDFLENNPEYAGFAHDTNYCDKQGTISYVHDLLKLNPSEKIEFRTNAPFLLISSRIFRNLDYAKKDILPIDYQMYYYHLSKGPIYYCDKRMSTYNVSPKSTFAYAPDLNLCLMQPYKIFQITDYKEDEFCSNLLKKYLQDFNMPMDKYNRLIYLKKIFGTVLGWFLWYVYTFILRYGFECLSLSYIYSNRALVKKRSDEIVKLYKNNLLNDRMLHNLECLLKKIRKRNKRLKYFLILFILLSIIFAVLYFLKKGFLI